MKLVIAGAGAVGFNLARELSADRHEISVIDPDPALIERLRDRVDVQAIEGSSSDAEVLKQCGTGDADIFIAVTNSDEVNLVSCAMAHALGARRRIARVRNPSLAGAEPLLEKRFFRVNRLVNPDLLASETTVRLIENPGVTFSAEFVEGEVLLRAFRLTESAGIHGVPLAELARRFPDRPFLVVAIEREGEVRVPRGDDTLEIGDVVYLLMLKDREEEFRRLLEDERGKAGRVVVYGASQIALSVVESLDRDVVLVDEKREEAERAAQRAARALVLCGWLSDEEVRREIDFSDVECFVAASDDDRMNLVAALYARQQGARRTLVVSREPDIVPLIEAVGFDAVINARLLAASAILRFVRPGKVLAVHRVGSGGAEAVELMVRRGSKAENKSLRELRLPQGAIVGAVFRDGAAFLPTGDTVLQPGDDIVAFVTDDVRDEVERMFAGKEPPLLGRRRQG